MLTYIIRNKDVRLAVIERKCDSKNKIYDFLKIVRCYL